MHMPYICQIGIRLHCCSNAYITVVAVYSQTGNPLALQQLVTVVC